ncbi:hypothetical protein C7B65_14765 [Phormidesmis priestleyi ULC007]|uniref:Bacteriocin n=1 Tax=Phormidesmis priestleyi ULC007 TaxID=1920490 RepID=A0A2T1DDL6_9CYAN|nr:CTB family bacteriocin [Phormidesmis priestleyi]PSB18557.1 hypothetical protein C7B65_14765 [Phormidesmis priestleyi ULC007]PZO49794.1 MAG: hypothetical protein DCF14_13315 [Phormidesmis priestleyi]
MTSESHITVELSAEDLDLVAGGARREAAAFTAELQDVQISTLSADRNGVRSTNIQETDDFKAAIFEVTETGN